MRKYAIDLTPIKKYRDFKLLFTAGLFSYFGSMITFVALPFQIKELTGSFWAVGLIGVVEIIPLIVFGLYGGVLADYLDRKKMIWFTEFGTLIATSILLINSLQEEPSVILIFVIAAIFAALSGLKRPSQDAILPRLVNHDDLPSASALMSLRWQFGGIVGPSVGGIIIASYGAGAAYFIDCLTFVISLALIWQVKSVPPLDKATPPSMAGLMEGLNYAYKRKDLLGTYVVDLAAMFLAMPMALFPFWADEIGAPYALGFFYSSITFGAVLVTLLSGWMRNYPHHGRAVIIGALGWGVAIVAAGSSNSLVLVITCLVIAGAFDQVSALFRGFIWNQSIPDELRGRLAGIEMLSYLLGPLGGQARAGGMAAMSSLRISIVGGGLLCIGFVSLIAASMPKFRSYDVRTNEYALKEAKVRKNRENI
ncbi:MAG: MFS transporter [Candidatus Nanopelagicales bacterium]|uniref:MFS transporter n=2 Tax=ac1 cluster TaxID=1655545 RepID=A0A0R2P735_9ACTN|nr:MAG: MFS transporter [Actinobacteria bacterium BACL2 MAG-121220-bin52]KRO74003.1 MAG: MFS transporter [Actinobacteria bacterium BACL2 MAG-120920-bin34]MDP4614599.1 MFS transporter [Candidatus Nanopelagicales bacterium]MDP4864858.1 MFS transporter [Candidatus Nanopelagicaceae bacterium]MDP4652633.1 MFS transporter [Candidatus Nanopelagicales bacterium]